MFRVQSSFILWETVMDYFVFFHEMRDIEN